VALNLCYSMYWYKSAVGRPYGAPLPLEVPYPIHQPQKKWVCKISVAVQLIAGHLEVNCQYKFTIFAQFCKLCIYNYIFATWCTGAPYLTKRLSGGGRPPPRPPPIAPPLHRPTQLTRSYVWFPWWWYIMMIIMKYIGILVSIVFPILATWF